MKFPEVILPIFFDKPAFLAPFISYTISISFDTTSQNPISWRSYIVKYCKNAAIVDASGCVKIKEQFTVTDRLNNYAYLESGQIRFLYFWPFEHYL